jgi:hypothetical protein
MRAGEGNPANGVLLFLLLLLLILFIILIFILLILLVRAPLQPGHCKHRSFVPVHMEAHFIAVPGPWNQ